MELKDVIAFAYSNSLGIALRADTAVGVKDSAVKVERNMTDVRAEDDEHVQGGVALNDD